VIRQEALRGTLVLATLAGVLVAVRQASATITPSPTVSPEVPPPTLVEQMQQLFTPAARRIRETLAPFDGQIEAAAITWGLDPDLLRAIIWQESKGDPLAARFEAKVQDTSYGLMQILLGTARSLGFAGSVQELLNPATNIMLGAQYLRSRFDQFGDFRLAVASYNSGSPIFADGTLVNEGYVRQVQRYLAALQGQETPVA